LYKIIKLYTDFFEYNEKSIKEQMNKLKKLKTNIEKINSTVENSLEKISKNIAKNNKKSNNNF